MGPKCLEEAGISRRSWKFEAVDWGEGSDARVAEADGPAASTREDGNGMRVATSINAVHTWGTCGVGSVSGKESQEIDMQRSGRRTEEDAQRAQMRRVGEIRPACDQGHGLFPS